MQAQVARMFSVEAEAQAVRVAEPSTDEMKRKMMKGMAMNKVQLVVWPRYRTE